MVGGPQTPPAPLPRAASWFPYVTRNSSVLVLATPTGSFRTTRSGLLGKPRGQLIPADGLLLLPCPRPWRGRPRLDLAIAEHEHVGHLLFLRSPDLVLHPVRGAIDLDAQPARAKYACQRLRRLERFIGILIEHFAGAFPLWVAPVQAVVIPIADRHLGPAEELADVLRAKSLRVEVDASDSRMQNKIRLAQEQKVPYMLVLGDREIEARSAAPRTRAGEQLPAEGWDALADRLATEAAARGA